MRALRLIPHVLLVVALATCLLIFKEWAYGATYRLYLDHRADGATGSTARQRFDLDPHGVVPRIVMRDERVAFDTAIGRDSTILARVTAAGPGSYEIHVRRGSTDIVVARGAVGAATAIAAPFPTGDGRIVIVSHGELTWSDLRVERGLRLAPEFALLGLLVVAAVMWKYAGSRGWLGLAAQWSGKERRAWLSAATFAASATILLVVVNFGLRAAAAHLPSGVKALRRDLGEPMEDPRWRLTERYGQRLAANLGGAPNEWRDGDIIRMGFVAPAMSERRVHRYAFHTDAEGFRNATVRDPIDVAALGDSFTDALTMAADAAWPAQLETRLGQAVQNYGTAGFGPQQERMVLEDFALPHHPRLVVLAFFAGNDIRDAERFDEFERGDHTFTQPAIGWPLREIFVRADTWYLTSLVQSAARNSAHAAPPKDVAIATLSAAPVYETSARFDRGVFTVPIDGHMLRFAFMPPYLNLLQYSEAELAARRGWTLALEHIQRMQRASRDAGAEFVLMFIPFKSQVYLPLIQRTFSNQAVFDALSFSLTEMRTVPDIPAFSRNRLAQNALMRRFCDREGIPFLDLTTVLQERVERGENMYFPDDSHLNEAGQAVTAGALAAFLQQRGLITQRRPE